MKRGLSQALAYGYAGFNPDPKRSAKRSKKIDRHKRQVFEHLEANGNRFAEGYLAKPIGDVDVKRLYPRRINLVNAMIRSGELKLDSAES